MELKINDQLKYFDALQLSVQELLDLEFPDRQKGLALAINNAVVPKTEWGKTHVSEQDQILIITATQGG